jgi:hypothetical protein
MHAHGSRSSDGGPDDGERADGASCAAVGTAVVTGGEAGARRRGFLKPLPLLPAAAGEPTCGEGLATSAAAGVLPAPPTERRRKGGRNGGSSSTRLTP